MDNIEVVGIKNGEDISVAEYPLPLNMNFWATLTLCFSQGSAQYFAIGSTGATEGVIIGEPELSLRGTSIVVEVPDAEFSVGWHLKVEFFNP